jgi:carbonic anhydrase
MNRFAVMTLILLAGSGIALAGHGPHWEYSGEEGPEHWGELDPHFSLCQTGRHQAPIDLATIANTHLEPLGFHYRPGGNKEINNGHTIQIDYEAGSTITVDGQNYELKQFHFHTPSENHIAGKAFPMEAHLVHADKDGHLAVVAVMFEEGAENTSLTTLWAAMPRQADSATHLPAKASAEGLLPPHRGYYRFTGSLTTPPCTEEVTWLVMKEPVKASHEQIAKFAKVLGHPNNRPIQPLNARLILD